MKTVTVQVGLDDAVYDKLPQSSIDGINQELDRVLTPKFVGGMANHLFQNPQLRALRVNGIVMDAPQNEVSDQPEPTTAKPI